MHTQEDFEFEYDGKKITAKKGQTIAEALLSHGVRMFRKTMNQSPRGVYCNMGVCYECRMIVNGIPNVRACMTAATPGCQVVTQNDAEIEVEGARS
jgi:predicted molibdopterin-dependent oxidoreductase YjgC